MFLIKALYKNYKPFSFTKINPGTRTLSVDLKKNPVAWNQTRSLL